MGYGYVIVPGTAGGGTKTLMKLPSQKGKLTYSEGVSQTPVWDNFDSEQLRESTTAKTDAGTYTSSFTPINGCRWADGSTTARYVEWTIDRATLTWSNKTYPKQSSTIPTYNGSEITASFVNLSYTDYVKISGNKAINSGTYNAYITPDRNHCWSDTKSYETRNIEWKINPISHTKPTLKTASVNYNGGVVYPTFNNYDNQYMNVSGNAEINAGTYTATISLNDRINHCWSDNSQDNLSFTWTINKVKDTTPVISRLNEGAGHFNVTSYIFLDSQVTTFDVDVSSKFAQGNIIYEITNVEPTTDDDVLNVSVDNNARTIRFTANKTGRGTIKISIAESDNTLQSNWLTLTYVVSVPCDMFEAAGITTTTDSKYSQLSSYIANGSGPNTFRLGDYFEVILNGAWMDLDFENEPVYAVLIDMDHNPGIEGTNTAHFQLGYKKIEDETGTYFVNIAFCGSAYQAGPNAIVSSTDDFLDDTQWTRGSLTLYKQKYLRNHFWAMSYCRNVVLNGYSPTNIELKGATLNTNYGERRPLREAIPEGLYNAIITVPKYSVNVRIPYTDATTVSTIPTCNEADANKAIPGLSRTDMDAAALIPHADGGSFANHLNGSSTKDPYTLANVTTATWDKFWILSQYEMYGTGSEFCNPFSLTQKLGKYSYFSAYPQRMVAAYHNPSVQVRVYLRDKFCCTSSTGAYGGTRYPNYYMYHNTLGSGKSSPSADKIYVGYYSAVRPCFALGQQLA